MAEKLKEWIVLQMKGPSWNRRTWAGTVSFVLYVVLVVALSMWLIKSANNDRTPSEYRPTPVSTWYRDFTAAPSDSPSTAR